MKTTLLEKLNRSKKISLPFFGDSNYFNWSVFIVLGSIAGYLGAQTPELEPKRTKVESYERCKEQPGTLVNIDQSTVKNPARVYVWNENGKKQTVENCIPDLDKNLVASLSEERKAQLVSHFFAIRHISGSNHKLSKDLYPKGTDINAERYVRTNFLLLQQEVKKGSELAYIDMHLNDYYDIDEHQYPMQFSEDNPFYQRLKEMAYNGNADAMCLYARRIPTPFPGYDHLTEYVTDYEKSKALALKRFKEGPDDKWIKGIFKAAKMGSASCMTTYALSLMDSKDPEILPQNIELGQQYLIKAATKNDDGAMWLLAYRYANGKDGFPYDLGKAKCWADKLSLVMSELNTPYKLPNLTYNIKSKIYFAKKKGISLDQFGQYDPKNNCQLMEEN